MKNKFYSFLEKNILIIFLITFLWILFSPFLLTQFSIIDLSKSGSIGDTIGGITAPAIGIFTAILLYLALMKQVENNDFIQYESNFRIIYDEIGKLKELYTNFEFEKKKGEKGFLYWSSHMHYEISQHKYTQELDDTLGKTRIALLHIERVLYLKKNLEINNKYNEFINKELNQIYSLYLQSAHDLMTRWPVDHCLNEWDDNSVPKQIYLCIIRVQDFWNTIRHEIIQQPITRA